MSSRFAALQAKLGPALEANRPGSTTPHVMIALPSYSVSESLMSHYGDRIAVLEHRYLNAVVIAGRIEACEMIYVSTRAPLPEVVKYAIEINLRKGGTTHPYAALRNLVPGRYDVASGQWIAHDGEVRAYTSTDNLVDERWLGLLPGDVIRAVAEAGLQFDPSTRVGTVLHMLAGLGVDGRIGVTAIAPTRAEADRMYEAARKTIDRLVG